MSFDQVVRDDLTRYLQHLAERVEAHLRALPRESVYVNPFSYGNSAGHLVLHLTGNLNHFIGAGIAGTGYVRDREREFTDPNPPAPEAALASFRAAVEMVAQTIAQQSAEDWCQPYENKMPIQTRFGLVLLCISHINNHVGQLAWLVQAMGRRTQDPPLW